MTVLHYIKLLCEVCCFVLKEYGYTGIMSQICRFGCICLFFLIGAAFSCFWQFQKNWFWQKYLNVRTEKTCREVSVGAGEAETSQSSERKWQDAWMHYLFKKQTNKQANKNKLPQQHRLNTDYKEYGI